MSIGRTSSGLVVSVLALVLAPSLVVAGCGGSSFTSSSAGSGGTSASAGLSSGGDLGEAGGLEPGAGAPSAGRGGARASGGSGGASHSAGASAGGKSGVAGSASSGAGGTVGSAGSANAGGTTSSAGAGPIVDTACPSDPPGEEACLGALTCTYGDDLRPACRASYQCVTGRWTAKLVKCTELVSCDKVPEGFPHQGDACTQVGEDCTLDNGSFGTVYCRCNLCTGQTCTQSWDCISPPSNCPLLAPNDGAACDASGMPCLYGNCEMVNALQIQCTKKTWRWSNVACPAN